MHKINAQCGRNASKFACFISNTKIIKRTFIDFGICGDDGTALKLVS